MYIIKYLSQQSQFGPTIYPLPGTWQDQMPWYIQAYSMGMNKLTDMRNKRSNKQNNKWNK